MKHGLKVFNGLIATALLLALSAQAPLFAKSESASTDRSGKQRYIVVLEDLPLAAYDGRSIQTPERATDSMQLEATATRFTGERKLDVNSERSKNYLQFLDQRFDTFRGEAALKLGRQLQLAHRYRIATNGFATELSAEEVKVLRDMPGVVSVKVDEIQHLQTDSGPIWLGADKIWDGGVGSGGEGVVVGVIDSGVNWNHPAFKDPGQGLPPVPGRWDHVNPYGQQLGLCSKTEVPCNDKLVGVYDFVTDNPDTPATEENTDGKDNAGHGSHVMSIAVGNPEIGSLNDIPTPISGVAPNANLISYRVCYIADPTDGDDDGCQTSAILKAIDQAVTDQVDVLNYSIGGDAYDPWNPGSTPLEFLNARDSGIFVATSTGNAGPNSGTIGSPANAPWIVAVGNATHDRVFASVLENLSGGDTAPPTSLVGASFTDGIGNRPIVHAKDYGHPLCGVGVPQSQADCAENTGASNPWTANTFKGEIVVCDRGEYGRVEKGKNLMLAGAGGYVLANTQETGDLSDIVADDHCLPATHIDGTDGNKLRTWLDSGANHRASISGFTIYHVDEAGDILSRSSSRGPNLPPAEDILKPDIIAPGTHIYGAGSVGSQFAYLSGTSMASPHVSGGAALMKSVHPDWTPSILASTMAMTATPALAVDFDGSVATPHKRGSGRPQLDLAVDAGLYLNETKLRFLQANPSVGGKPKDLNLPGLVDTVCRGTCVFQRTVTGLADATWSATAQGFAEGVSVSITPNNFSLANGGQQALGISVDLSQSGSVGKWVYGEVRLTSTGGHPDAVFPLAVFSDGGALPAEWQINTDAISGWKEFTLSGLAPMPDATYTSGGLVEPTETSEVLPQDPVDDPYDGLQGKMTVRHTVPAGTLWLHTETLASAVNGLDLDLYVGLDANKDGIAQESEELCSSTSPTAIELCDIFTPVAGEYWVIVQNWVDASEYDSTKQSEAKLVSAVVGKNSTSLLAATGTGINPGSAALDVRLSWDNVSAVPGTELMGAVGIGTDRANPNNIGIIPVKFTKTRVEAPKTLVLMNGISRGLTLAGNDMHDLAFIDVPAGVESLTVTASAAESGQSNNLEIELYRVDFDDAFADAPFASVPDTTGNPVKSASGANGIGPSVMVSGSALLPGRWYAVLKNNSLDAADIEIKADLVSTGAADPVQFGLWEPSSRVNIHQGIDFSATDIRRALIWYTFDEDGQPAWYIAAGIVRDGNVWVAELTRYTNDGLLQQLTTVGHASITILGEKDIIFSFVLFGDEGSDRMVPNSSPDCPIVGGLLKSYDGLWSRTNIGVGGASVMVNAVAQAFVHYIYDDHGNPVWWTAAASNPQIPTVIEMPINQWTGFCPTCTETVPSYETVGLFSRTFDGEYELTWTLDYVLNPPLSGTMERTDVTEKLTLDKVCQ